MSGAVRPYTIEWSPVTPAGLTVSQLPLLPAEDALGHEAEDQRIGDQDQER